ncbi:MAG: hypothetical protein VKJ24_07140 [Synechococcales bacterium]|nr:hypothetical protein [Synechococcales bacterium]
MTWKGNAGLMGLLWLCPVEQYVYEMFPIAAYLEARMQLQATAAPKASPTCQFTPPPKRLRSTTRYGIFGNDEFDSLVCGYLVIRQEQRFEEEIQLAYFRITQFYEQGLQQAIATGIENKNAINAKTDGYYELGLGCYQNGRIIGTEYDRKLPYLPTATQQQLFKSSAQKPVRVILSFGKHTGEGCDCCNLPHQIRIY